MKKLIKTKLLSKYHHTSDVGYATASHLDYARFYSKQTYLNARLELKTMLQAVFFLPFSLFIILTRGLILVPFAWIYHIFLQKRLIKQHTIEKINQHATELEQELSNADRERL